MPARELEQQRAQDKVHMAWDSDEHQEREPGVAKNIRQGYCNSKARAQPAVLLSTTGVHMPDKESLGVRGSEAVEQGREVIYGARAAWSFKVKGWSKKRLHSKQSVWRQFGIGFKGVHIGKHMLHAKLALT
eukprot:scaffold54893_cov16-Tisochrysis_lutea.AAC.1